MPYSFIMMYDILPVLAAAALMIFTRRETILKSIRTCFLHESSDYIWTLAEYFILTSSVHNMSLTMLSFIDFVEIDSLS